jgi:ABC-type transporter Mla subunit MlaD
MALQDLTPELRTRLSRMERAVGWFVALAVLVLACGFGYYAYSTAERKGWFKTKASYFTYVHTATGLKVGDPVKLMGFNVGEITRIDAEAPFRAYDIYVEFVVTEPYYDYLWTQGSKANVGIAGLLEQRVLEVTKGTSGYPTYTARELRQVTVEEARGLADGADWGLAQEVYDRQGTRLLGKPWQPLTNLAAIAEAGHTSLRLMNKREKGKALTGVWNSGAHQYEFYSRSNRLYWLEGAETPAVTEQAQRLVAEVQQALPGVFGLTNQLSLVLSNSAQLTSNLNAVALAALPAVSNLAAATKDLNRPGALGEWLVPTNLNHQLEITLTNANVVLGTANTTMNSANTNLVVLAENLNRSLESLAGITSNLNTQVEANTNLLRTISDTIVHADQFVQGLKHHWLLRSAFKMKDTNAPPAAPVQPLRSPKESGE